MWLLAIYLKTFIFQKYVLYSLRRILSTPHFSRVLSIFATSTFQKLNHRRFNEVLNSSANVLNCN